MSEAIASVEEVPTETTYLFRVRDVESGDVDEAILTRLSDGVVGYVNRCMHFRHIRLDKGAGAPFRDGEVVCSNHGAMFEADTGTCTYGPCAGAVLQSLSTEERAGDVYLVDDDYEYVGDGAIETDPADLASTSNVEF